ncbi:type II secretion system F family protein [Streptomyces sp. NPDC005805]|uniref:type II secretion system F family protein n=1 Tax=Streptomyces sp. NPDC005805 TaxID=3157068 RepID=UPI0033E7BEF8
MTADTLHRLGAVLSGLAAAGALVALVSAHRRARAGRRRIEALLSVERQQRRARAVLRHRLREAAAPLGALAACYVLVGGPAGALVGVVAGLGVRYGVRRRQRAGAGRRGGDGEVGAPVDPAVAARQLPLAADLLAACITAGAGPREAAEAVGQSLGGPVGGRLAAVAAHLRLGREPVDAWEWFGRSVGADALARCLERADSTGVPMAEPMARLADRLRAERARATTARGRRAQVQITAPVGLCFLPAFLAIGVAPVVIGLVGGLLRAG